MTKIEKPIIRELNRTRRNPKFLCNAPFTSMNITFPGVVTPCCYNSSWHDDYHSHSINEIWNGNLFNSYREKIKRNELPESCAHCENALRNKEFHSVKLHQYDGLKVSRIFRNKIRKLDISLSNACNLECIMCIGSNCNRIRQNREHLPPIENIYGQKFRNELKPLLPDIQEIVFLGGEPFLNPLYYDIWEDMIAINPNCRISVVTNGTILNNRIKSLLERGNFEINISFDAMTKETYEAIRINAKFEETMANMKYFGDTLAQQGKRLSIILCPLQINRFEIPDLLRFCNYNNYSFTIVPELGGAVDVAMYSMSSQELKETKDFYLNQKFSETDENSKKNIRELIELTQRIDRWIELAIRKENFKELFDLQTDMVDSYKKQLYDKLFIALSRQKKLDNDSINKQMNYFNNMLTELITSLPKYYYSNHFFKKLLTVPIEKTIHNMSNSSISSLKNLCKVLFYYS